MDPDAHTAPRLTIETGVHRSASSTVARGDTRVGSALEADVGVTDVGVPCAFLLRHAGATVLVRAVDADLDIGGKRLRPGQERACRGTKTLTSGRIRFRLDVPAGRNAAAVSRPRRWPALTAAFAAGSVGAAVLTVALSLHAAPFTLFPVQGGAPDIATSVPAPPSTSAVAKPSSAALLGGLRRRAAEAGIETLDLRLQPDGAIAASGTLAPFQEQAWHDVGRWFDTEAQGRFVLVDNVSIAKAAPALQIQAVWPGRNPYVVDGGGQKLFVGSAMQDGWTIRAIDRSRVLIKRGEQVVAVRF